MPEKCLTEANEQLSSNFQFLSNLVHPCAAEGGNLVPRARANANEQSPVGFTFLSILLLEKIAKMCAGDPI